MTHAVLNPSELHDPAPFGYSHTARIPAGKELVFVAGQYGSGPDGTVVSTDFAEQVERSFHNLRIALAAHGLTPSDVVQLRTYVVDLGFAQLGAIAQAVRGLWPNDPPTQTVLGVAGLATPEIRFEVEAVAARS